MAEPAVKELQRGEENVEIIWRAFELRPEPVPTLPPDGEYLTRVWDSSVYPLAERLGMKMKLPPVQPRSRLAHEAAKWAGAQGYFDVYNKALFQAFFERGEDIGEIEVLAWLAADLSLDGEALKKSLENGEFLESVIDDEREAQQMGLSGVPAFIAGREAATTGVQSLESLQKLLAYVRHDKST